MKPVFQTRTGSDGNCYFACLASILELGIDQVPDIPNVLDWQQQVQNWLRLSGLAVVTVPFDHAEERHCIQSFEAGEGTVDWEWRAHWRARIMPGYSILAVLSPRRSWETDAEDSPMAKSGARYLHAVVAKDGEVVHDPHPDYQDGIYRKRVHDKRNWREYDVFVALAPTQVQPVFETPSRVPVDQSELVASVRSACRHLADNIDEFDTITDGQYIDAVDTALTDLAEGGRIERPAIADYSL